MKKSSDNSRKQLIGTFFEVLLIAGTAGFIFVLLTNGLPLLGDSILSVPRSKNKLSNIIRIYAICLLVLILAARKLFPERQNEFLLVRFADGLKESHYNLLTGILFLWYAGIGCATGFVRQLALETRAFDLGIFSQALWNTLHGDWFQSSIKGGMNIMGDHFSPILLLLAPFYAVFPDPKTVLYIQAIVMASCIPLIYLFAKKMLRDHKAAFVFAFSYFLYFPSRAVFREDFHPEVFAEPLILLAMLALHTDRKKIFMPLLSVFFLIKENMIGVVCMFGVYLAAFFKKFKSGALIIITAVAAFIAVVHLIIPGIGGEGYLYTGFYRELLASPARIFPALFNGDNLSYICKLFSPVAFLSFFHPSLILTFPVLFQNLLSANEVMRSFNYHYTLGLTPFVYASAVLGYQRLVGRKIKPFFLLWGIVILSVLRAGPADYFYLRQSLNSVSPEVRSFADELSQIPSEASVLTHNNIIPQLVNRKKIYQFDYRNEPTKIDQVSSLKPDYVILGVRFWEENTQALEPVLSGLSELGYRETFSKSDFYIFCRDK